MSFRLDAVQLIKYIPYGDDSAESFGFAQEKNAFYSTAFVAEDEEVENVDVPFTDGDDGEDF